MDLKGRQQATCYRMGTKKMVRPMAYRMIEAGMHPHNAWMIAATRRLQMEEEIYRNVRTMFEQEQLNKVIKNESKS